ncbi:bZIP transcription factor domain-containing protein [Pochonia chlamydosporia 170]|uniref:BZIP transcription factor domain-containing protein n=1 Tax=Pochonia chlamydosporia 170 TaxID=1380566 RepID=A0A179EXU5_METCM|nr:bZIP transcription factor domain-containing protein [Pochonia chlamydosporia 170]OAQ57739.1 bZIP transcription factor domain-containing protein [Pochonia chlamydosporia 170]
MSDLKWPATASTSARRKEPRTTTNLSPEQLARKRANDRVSQRAARERTKQYIARLECEIRHLISQINRNETIEELTRRNQKLTDEVNFLRKYLTLRNGEVSWTASRGLNYVDEHLSDLCLALPSFPYQPACQQANIPINAAPVNTVSPPTEFWYTENQMMPMTNNNSSSKLPHTGTGQQNQGSSVSRR